MTVKNATPLARRAFHSMALPPTASIYVDNTVACTAGYVATRTYTDGRRACGNVWVSGQLRPTT